MLYGKYESEYKINSSGYRAPEFDTVDWGESYIIQGCSACFGKGIENDSDTVAANLERLIGKSVINLGVCGSSATFQYLNTISMIEKNIVPKGVFVIWPNLNRYPEITDSAIEHIGPWSDDRFVQWTLKNNSVNHNSYNIRAWRIMWKLLDVPTYEMTHHPTDICKIVLDEFLDRGTDGMHWGPRTAKHVATLLHNEFKVGSKCT